MRLYFRQTELTLVPRGLFPLQEIFFGTKDRTALSTFLES